MDMISHIEICLLGKFYMHLENNALFMTKNVYFEFFPWAYLEHSKKNTDKFSLNEKLETLDDTLKLPQNLKPLPENRHLK